MIVLDTNVLSEVTRLSPAPGVIQWLASQEPLNVFISAVTQAEILYGIEALPAGKRRRHLAETAERVFVEGFRGRILPFDEDAARIFPKIVVSREALGRPISQIDAMIAAVARSRRAALATRNTRDFEGCEVRLINPWQ